MPNFGELNQNFVPKSSVLQILFASLLHCTLVLALNRTTIATLCQSPALRAHYLNATCRNVVGRNMLRAYGHPVATCCDMLGVVGSSLKMIKFGPTHPTCRSRVAKRVQHVVPNNVTVCLAGACKCWANNVATCCVDMLRLFGWGLKLCMF